MLKLKKNGQISLEFSLLFLGVLLAIVIAVGYPGMFGFKKTVSISSMSLAHAAVSKMKQNIELVAAADEGTTKIVYIKCPPGYWGANKNIVYFYRDGDIKFNITANCNININLNGNKTVSTAKIIIANITKINESYVNVTIWS
ncbi:Protein of unknown function DUF361 [Methanocaldococcus sp. FS406-22]|uniref:class III signal peptide-containing protein n=1 Tax=Methanocaldococcus sp. (strain FS406-22) TaxID=644281 RepID=UPI0001BF2A38|nr:class III signal peptide-containing protein [Methanocaldococcus sp. FS406-22]ADC70007.1 Protein of unknown function DUF361 [Methanocaldococcus sp. FS406-22]